MQYCDNVAMYRVPLLSSINSSHWSASHYNVHKCLTGNHSFSFLPSKCFEVCAAANELNAEKQLLCLPTLLHS